MTGATPCTDWLRGCVALDASGFIKTGPDLTADDLAAREWPLPRAPHFLETSLPGVFAVGDVRSRNMKRVASAVGRRFQCGRVRSPRASGVGASDAERSL